METTSLRTSVLERLEDRRLMSAAVTVIPATALNVTGHGETLQVEATDAFSRRVVVLSGVTGAAADFSNLTAIINWGDGSAVTNGKLVQRSDGTIAVRGGHTYATTGTFTIDVLVSERPALPPGQPNPYMPIIIADVKSTATAIADEHEGGVSLTETATAQFSATVGTFDFANPGLGIAAVINWGDGRQSLGQVVQTGENEYAVIGTHKYAAAGTYTAHVSLTAAPIGGPGQFVPQYIIAVANWDSTIRALRVA
jgi:hypothetical protein